MVYDEAPAATDRIVVEVSCPLNVNLHFFPEQIGKRKCSRRKHIEYRKSRGHLEEFSGLEIAVDVLKPQMG